MRASGKRVLVVEDEYVIAKGLVRDLGAMGADVVGPVPSVLEALALIAAVPLDGALVDVNLRGEPAFSVADALAERAVPYVFTTGYAAEALPDRYAAVPRCGKPAKSEALVEALFPGEG